MPILLLTTSLSLFQHPLNTLTHLHPYREQRTNILFKEGFSFEKLGIGGLDAEFSDIFRRAFASRVFPKGVMAKLGMKHVKGMHAVFL